MSWRDTRTAVLAQKETLDRNTSSQAIMARAATIQADLAKYVNSAGISSTEGEDPNTRAINNSFGDLIQLEKQYGNLLRQLTTKINSVAQDTNVSQKLNELGQARNKIIQLEQEVAAAKQDADTSRTRQLSVEQPRQEATWYQGFGSKIGFHKPLKQISVPVLIGFGVLMLFLSGLLLREFFTITEYYNSTVISSESVFIVFSDSRFYAVAGGIVFIGVVLGILSYTGYLGKKLK